MWSDIQYGLRQVRRSTLFAAAVVLLLAARIGANTVIFSFVNALLLKPLPVRNPENLYLLQKIRARQVRPDTASFYRQFQSIAQHDEVFSSVIAEQEWGDGSFQPFSEGDRVRLITTQMVSPNYFSELGVRVVAGRVLGEADAKASSDIPVVLSYQFWASEFNRDRGAIGRVIRVKNYPFLVVGILEREFHGIDVERAPDVRLPISAAAMLTGSTVTEPAGEYPIRFEILARLSRGVAAGRAAAGVFSVTNGMEETLWRDFYARSTQTSPAQELQEAIAWERSYHLALLEVGRGVSQLREQFSRAVFILMGAVALLLVAVCANVAGLLLARCEERKREIAIRLSVGANRLGILRQLFVENLLLAIPSTGFGVALAYGVAPWLLRLLPRPRGLVSYATPLLLEVTLDKRVLLFAIAVSLITLVLFGILPARHALKIDLNEQLKGASAHTTTVSSRTATVAIQVAFGVMLAVGASVMFRTFWNLDHLNPGFDRAHVVEFTIDPRDAGYSGKRAGALFRDLRERVSAIPGVRAVSFASIGLMRGIGIKATVAPQGVVLPEKTFLNTSLNRVTNGYFRTLGIPLLAGRNLNLSDVGRKPEHIVINQVFASLLFPRQDPIGKAVVQGVDGTKPPTAVVVGVVGTAKYRSLREPDPPIYYSVSDDANAGGIMYVRTFGDPAQIINAVRSVLRNLAPTVLVRDVFTLEQEVQNSLWQERLVTILCMFFAIAALLISGAGFYGVLAYSVARRSRELGIRIAVGAQVRHILETVCLRMLVSIVIGLAGGVLCAAAVIRVAGNLVFGVSPEDPISFSIATAALLLCMAFAAIGPAWRATRTDPVRALRVE